MNIIRSVLARLELFNTRFNELKKTRNVYKKRNSIILSDFNRKSRLNRVNLHYWKPVDGSDNLGDYLSTVVVNYLVPDYQNIILVGEALVCNRFYTWIWLSRCDCVGEWSIKSISDVFGEN